MFCLTHGVTMIFYSFQTRYATTMNQTHVSSVAPSPGILAGWSTEKWAKIKYPSPPVPLEGAAAGPTGFRDTWRWIGGFCSSAPWCARPSRTCRTSPRWSARGRSPPPEKNVRVLKMRRPAMLWSARILLMISSPRSQSRWLSAMSCTADLMDVYTRKKNYALNFKGINFFSKGWPISFNSKLTHRCPKAVFTTIHHS